MSIFSTSRTEQLRGEVDNNADVHIFANDSQCINAFEFKIGYKLKESDIENKNIKKSVLDNFKQSDFLQIIDRISVEVKTLTGANKSIIDLDKRALQLYIGRDGAFTRHAEYKQREANEIELPGCKGGILLRSGQDYYVYKRYVMPFYNPADFDPLARELGGLNIGQFEPENNVDPNNQISQVFLRVKLGEVLTNKIFKGTNNLTKSQIYFKIQTYFTAHQKNITSLESYKSNILKANHPGAYFYGLLKSSLNVSGGRVYYNDVFSYQIIDGVYFVAVNPDVDFENYTLTENNQQTNLGIKKSTSDGVRDGDAYLLYDNRGASFRPPYTLECLGVLKDLQHTSRFFINDTKLSNGGFYLDNQNGGSSCYITTNLANNETSNQQVEVYTFGFRTPARA